MPPANSWHHHNQGRKKAHREKQAMHEKNVRTMWMVIATAASIANAVKAALLSAFV